MVKKYLLVKDNERDFAARLIARLNELYGEIDILIVYEDEARGLRDDEIFVFSDERTDNTAKIYKFQKAADIRREILAKSGGVEDYGSEIKTSVTLLITPSGNAAQRDFMYEEVARRSVGRTVLAINIGYFGKAEESVGAIGLSELCFELYKGLGSTIDRPYIEKAIEEYNGIDYLRPFSSPVHLMQLKGELAELINIIEKTCKYDELFISAETLFPRIDELMVKAGEVIVLRASDEEETEFEKDALMGLREYMEHVGVNSERIKEKAISCRITEN